MLIPRTPNIIRHFFPKILFRLPQSQPTVYLTFDDGPQPEVTPFVLEHLKAFQFHATFFVLGKHVQQYPELTQEVLQAKHRIGNHTQNHLCGWKSSDEKYLQNIQEADQSLNPFTSQKKLFRPPYGKMRLSQIRKISYTHQIVLWDVLSEDYNLQLSEERILKKLKKQTRNGSIIVFHDSQKSYEKLKNILPSYLHFLREKGYVSKAIPECF